MAIKLNPTKANIVINLLKSNSNRFTTSQLLTAAGNERRARSALSHARMAGVTLEAIRDSGRAVTAYVLNGSVPAIAPAASRAKAAKAKSPKAAAKAKTVDHSASNKLIAKALATGKIKTAKVVSVDDSAVRAKNLETIKAVHAKTKQKVAKHPITGRDLTDDQADVLEEFRTLELAYETEEQERNAARAAVRENLPKEVYAE